MENLIILAILALIVGGAARYVWRARKRGVKCIGCPEGTCCSRSCSGCSGNCCGTKEA